MTQPTFTPPEPNAALVVGPDDHLVIALPRHTTRGQLAEFRALLDERLRDRVTIVAGAEQLAVVRKAAS